MSRVFFHSMIAGAALAAITSSAEAATYTYAVTFQETYAYTLGSYNYGLGNGSATLTINNPTAITGTTSVALGSDDSLTNIIFSPLGSAWQNAGGSVGPVSDTNLTGITAFFVSSALSYLSSTNIGEVTLATSLKDVFGYTYKLVLDFANPSNMTYSIIVDGGPFNDDVKERGTVSFRPTPVPAALPLLAGGAGVIGMALKLGRRNKKNVVAAA